MHGTLGLKSCSPPRNLKLQINGQKQPPEVFCKKDVLRNFAKFTGKHLCQSLFYRLQENQYKSNMFSI